MLGNEHVPRTQIGNRTLQRRAFIRQGPGHRRDRARFPKGVEDLGIGRRRNNALAAPELFDEEVSVSPVRDEVLVLDEPTRRRAHGRRGHLQAYIVINLAFAS
jgi:hypothetical protein